MFCASCKDGEDTVFEELQCVPARGRPLVEEDLFGCYRYIDPLELPLLDAYIYLRFMFNLHHHCYVDSDDSRANYNGYTVRA
jgi:hypothetical protein